MRSFTPSKRLLLRMAMLALIVLATGCITIEEHYTFKKNGSGTMEYVVDMSAMKDMMKSFSDNKANTKDDPLMSGSDEKVKQLKDLEGVQKVKLKNEQEGFVQRISFAFKDVDALNRALNVLMPDSTGAQQAFFRWDGNVLVRSNNRFAEGVGRDMGGSDAADTTGLAEVLKSMHYKYSFKFANGVKDVQLADGMAKESPGAKKLELATDWSVIMKDPKALDLRIALDK